jgi:kumamolisin
LIPIYLSTRTKIFATVVVALIVTSFHQASAAQSILETVHGERVSNVLAMDDSARPAANAPLSVTFAINSTQAQNIDSYVATLTDPSSPNYHKWMTPVEFGQKFGASDDDVNAVTEYLIGHHFSNVKIWSNRLFVTGQISRSDAEQAFDVTIHGYDRDPNLVMDGLSPTYYAPDRDPSLPSDIAERVGGIFGLSNAMQRKSAIAHAVIRPDATAVPPLDPPAIAGAYQISALHTAGLSGKGETIAIFSPTTYTATDVSTFFTDEKIAEPTINLVKVGTGPTDDTDAIEACLDIETIGSIAPLATINVYEGPNDGSFDIFQQVAQDDTAQILSESYGYDETYLVAALGTAGAEEFATSYDAVRAQLSGEGITIFVASGDNGAYAVETLPSLVPSVAVDASSQYVTGVGGTELTVSSTNVWQNEAAWTFNDEAASFGPDLGSNGGLSIFYAQPPWQAGPGVNNNSSDGFRQVPDVAALAGTPGYNVYTTAEGSTGFEEIQGTSGACPLWAASMSLIDEGYSVGKGLGNINPSLYTYGSTESAAYHDITAGNNGVYLCTPNWDYVTGWGSANFNSLYEAFEGQTVGGTTNTTLVHTFGPGLQLFSIPYNYQGTGYVTASLLTGLVTPAGLTTTDIAAYVGADDGYEITPNYPANVPIPGQGYWGRFKSSTGGGLLYAGTQIVAQQFAVDISPGWNMIGDPYINPLPINSIQVTVGGTTESFAAAVANSVVEPNFYGYNGTGYVPYGAGQELSPYAGYWLYSSDNGVLTFPAP